MYTESELGLVVAHIIKSRNVDFKRLDCYYLLQVFEKQ